MVLIVCRVGDDKERSQQPGGQVATRRDADSLVIADERDCLAELQLPVTQPIGIHNRRGKHEGMQLAHKDIQTFCGEFNLTSRSEGAGLVEGHVLRSSRVKQARESVHGVGGVTSIAVGGEHRSVRDLNGVSRLHESHRFREGNRFRHTASFGCVDEGTDALVPGARLVGGDEFNRFGSLAGWNGAQHAPGL